MGQIHIMCLKEWLNSKRLVYEGQKVTSYFWKALECELCKEPFENKMRSSMFAIMQFERPERNYMILESIKSAPAKVVHVFDLKHDQFKVGRSVETDMKIADISVSRTHSFFKIKDNKIVVEDNGSKFGTLVKIQRPVDLLAVRADHTSTIFQVGRTLIYLQLQAERSLTHQFYRQRPKPNGVMAGEEELGGDYLQLRKDLMKVPKQFYLNRDPAGADAEGSNKVGDYFRYISGDDENALAIKEQLSKDKKHREMLARSSGAQARAPATAVGGHPLVPKLNLPPPDQNQQWREILAQARSINEDSSDALGPSSSSDWESEEEEQEEEAEQSVVEESKRQLEEKKEPNATSLPASQAQAQSPSLDALEDRRQSKEQSKSHEKKRGDVESQALEDSAEMEFEEQKVEEPHESAAGDHVPKHSKSRSGNRSRRRQKRSNGQKLSRTAIIEAAHGKRGKSEHNIVIAGDTVVVDKNRSQALAQQANDGSVGASESVNGVVKRNTRSKSNGRNPAEQPLPRADLVFKDDAPSN